ncbi:MAG: PQQ-binding-like beta-propeller repeat protein [Verrucomicrobia bacterium]|nr:PQQ-binding-like beta-propeller repeat protein [Verrucomicrobiota bacterium]
MIWLLLLSPLLLAPERTRATEAESAGGKESNVASLSFWPQWRGPMANGSAPKAQPPLRWSETNHLRWRAAIPGKAHSSPVVWGDRVFLTTAIPVGEPGPPVYDNAPGSHDNLPVTQTNRFVLLAVSRKDGRVLWQRTVREEFPHEGGHRTGSLTSASPITDGEHVWANFGSHGLYCFTVDGELRWKKDLGQMHTLHAHGEGSSPALHGDSLVLNWDQESDSKLYCFDKRTGSIRWVAPRDEETSWSTPLIVEMEETGKRQIVVSATKRIRGYDLATGAQIWECGGLARNVVASPVESHGVVIAGNSYDWQAMLAIRLKDARGDVTDTAGVAWKLTRLTPYVPSPLVYEDTLYFLRHNQNILSRVDPQTGKHRGDPVRLPELRDIFASPVAAAGRIYITGREGMTVVVKHDRENTLLAVNRLDDVFSASPALVDHEIYLRGERFLYCIAED